MDSLIDQILIDTEHRLEERRSACSLAELKSRVRDTAPTRSLRDALSGDFCVIAEHLRRSPTGGKMDDRNVRESLDVYDRTPWIAAVSVLTDQDHFDGSLQDLVEARSKTGKPILRKDFIVDSYQVWEARAFGADAVLLMAGLHMDCPQRLHELFSLANELGLEALVELGGAASPAKHSNIVPREAAIWGINARRFDSTRFQLRRFLPPSERLFLRRNQHKKYRQLIPSGKIAVAESGVSGVKQLRSLRDLGYNAALVGRAFNRGTKTVGEVVRELSLVFSTKEQIIEPQADQTDRSCRPVQPSPLSTRVYR